MDGSGQAKNLKIHPGHQTPARHQVRPAALMRVHKDNVGTGIQANTLGTSKGIVPVL